MSDAADTGEQVDEIEIVMWVRRRCFWKQRFKMLILVMAKPRAGLAAEPAVNLFPVPGIGRFSIQILSNIFLIINLESLFQKLQSIIVWCHVTLAFWVKFVMYYHLFDPDK
ncbi:hypothetical protein D3C81_1310560 [compost metagenome]